MNFERLDKHNIILYAIQNYNNPSCTGMQEFTEDYNRIKYLKKLFEIYLKEGKIKERLFLNHLIIFYNVFGIEAGTRILFHKMESKYWSVLKACLLYLNVYKENIKFLDVNLAEIPEDKNIITYLETI